MKIKIQGEKNGKNGEIQYILYDETDTTKGIPSMSRTTGYTCTAAATMVATGLYKREGISPPEYLGEEQVHFDFVLNYLSERNVNLTRSEKII